MLGTRTLLWLQDNTHRNRDSPVLRWASLSKTRGGSEGSLTLPRRHFGGARIGSLVLVEQHGSSLLAPGERSAPGIRGRLKVLLTWPGAALLRRAEMPRAQTAFPKGGSASWVAFHARGDGQVPSPPQASHRHQGLEEVTWNGYHKLAFSPDGNVCASPDSRIRL